MQSSIFVTIYRMNSQLLDLIKKIKPGVKLKVGNKIYLVKQHIVWCQHRAGYSYDKWVLVDQKSKPDHRLFIDSKEKAIGLASIFHYSFQEPLPKNLIFEGKKYQLTWSEFCTAIKVNGKGPYQRGENEIWWDYVLIENKRFGLSLGRSWQTWKREDLRTVFLEINDLILLK